MIVDIITLFPDMFKGPFDESIVKKAQEKKLVKINIHNLRKWGIDKRRTVDDRPYGGGKGMLLRPEPIFDAVKDLTRSSKLATRSSTILLSPTGKVFNQKKARQFAKKDHLILICGHYEGVDYRVHKYLVDEAISIGDYILTGGEIPAMVIIDSVVRLISGVLEKEATELESFSNIATKLLEYPQYTRPETFRGHKVPKVLLSGNHQEIEKWRQKQALSRTRKLRPNLLKEA